MQNLEVDGRLKADAVIKTSKNGKQYLFFELANTNYVMGEFVTTWYSVQIFDVQTINQCKTLHKGAYILVAGFLQIDTNTVGDKTYVNRTIRAHKVDFLYSSRPNNEEHGANTGTTQQAVYRAEVPQPKKEVVIPNKLTNEDLQPTQPQINLLDVGDDDDDLPF